MKGNGLRDKEESEDEMKDWLEDDADGMVNDVEDKNEFGSKKETEEDYLDDKDLKSYEGQKNAKDDTAEQGDEMREIDDEVRQDLIHSKDQRHG